MNSAKKALKNQDNPVRLGDAGDKKNPVVLILVIAIVSIVLIAGVAYENLSPQNAVTIDGKKISINKMMYNIWNVESQYDYYDRIYQAWYQTSYWDMTADSETGATYADQAKDEVMNMEIQMTLLYEKALEEGYSLTDEETTEVEDEIKEITGHYTFWNRMRLGFTKSYLKKQLTRAKIVSRYREDLIDGFDVDDDAITAGFDKDEYKEYEISYYYAGIVKEDGDGNQEELPKKELSELTEELQALREMAGTAEDFSKLLGDGEDEESSDSDDNAADGEDAEDEKFTYGTESFIEKDGWKYASDENCDVIKALKVDEISDVIVDKESGYMYFVRLEDNTSTETYDQEVKDAITDAEEEAFTEYYNELYAAHKVSINEKVWSSVTMGSVTTGIEYIETPEDAASKSGSESDEGDGGSEDEGTDEGDESSSDDSTEDTEDGADSTEEE